MYLQTCGRFKSANRKKGVTFEKGPQILQIIQARKFADMRVAELICGPPTFGCLIIYL
jgi:hypothetical protein